MGAEFKIENEVKGLITLANVHDDQDGGSKISPEDLARAPKRLLKAIGVDDELQGSISEKAQTLSRYLEEIRFADFLMIDQGVLSQGQLQFFSEGWQEVRDPVTDGWKSESLRKFLPVQEFVAAHQVIQSCLEQRYPPKEDLKNNYFFPSKPQWRKAFHPGNQLRMTQGVYEELRSAYDCKTEQIYLLLAHRKTGVIEKVLRPRYRELDHACGFEEHWQDYVASNLRLMNSSYFIVGTYHSHPGLQSKGFAAYNPSPDDGAMALEYGGVEIIGHAETEQCDSDEFSRTFQINAYSADLFKTRKKFPLRVVPGKQDSVFLDGEFAQSRPFHRGKETITLDKTELEAIVASLEIDDEFNDRDQKELNDAMDVANQFSLEIIYYYDGSYSVSVQLKKEDTFMGLLGFSYSPNQLWHGGRGTYQGRVDFNFVTGYVGHGLSSANELRLLQALGNLLKKYSFKI